MNIIRRHPTSLSTYRPRAMDEQFGRLVENMFEDMLAPFTQGAAMSPWLADGPLSPRMNVSETEQAFEVQADMPGVAKEDVKVAIDHQRVTIEGESRRQSEQREGENQLYTERSACKYMRSFTLPTDVDESQAQARMENGVLSLTLPKKQGSSATRIAIQ
ncbi:MAG: Hsp20/alpha crystallin family protein [Massilia sp.]